MIRAPQGWALGLCTILAACASTPAIAPCEPFTPDSPPPSSANRGPAEPGADTTALGEALRQPELLNSRQIERELVRQYPARLRELGVGGVTSVWVQVDPAGTARESRIQRSSGTPELDELALKLARRMRFRPAQRGDCSVWVWAAYPITFASRLEIPT